MLQEFAQMCPPRKTFAREIYEIVQRGFPQAHLEKVKLEETMMNSFEYSGGGEPR